MLHTLLRSLPFPIQKRSGPPRRGRSVTAGLGALSLAFLVACTGPEAPAVPSEGGGSPEAGAGLDDGSGGDPGAGEAVPAPAPTPTPTPDPFPTPGAPSTPSEDGPNATQAPDLGVDVRLTEVGRLESPTGGAVAPDGTVHLISRRGTVHPLREDGVGEAVLDLREEVSTGSERGLLGIAFAPEGDEVFLSWTDRDGDSVVTAFAVEDGRIDPERRRTVLTQDQPYGNHNGGDLAFGPEGNLYLSLGDGGGAGDPLGAGQDLGTPLGSLLRIDPDGGEPYGIPDGNPFVEDEEARDEIYAYGLRNPWRFSFDARTGDLWVGDVGQSSREEINRAPANEVAGANFGWSLMEGNRPFNGDEPSGHVPPVHTYQTTAERCAVTGGYVYRGEEIPELRGAYLFSDYCEGLIRALVVDRSGAVAAQGDLGVDGGSVVSFVQGADGELYVLDLAGRVLRLDPT